LAQIHPHIQALLSHLLEGPAAPLAVQAIARIQSDDDTDLAFDRSRLERDDSPRGRAFRQLALADQAVSWPLKRELDLTERLAGIAGELGIDNVNVIPAVAEGQQAVELPDRLLSQARRKAIFDFLAVWGTAMEDVGAALEGDFAE
jgi:hypothetical protein